MEASLAYSSVMVCSFDEGVGRAWKRSKDFDYDLQVNLNFQQ